MPIGSPPPLRAHRPTAAARYRLYRAPTRRRPDLFPVLADADQRCAQGKGVPVRDFSRQVTRCADERRVKLHGHVESPDSQEICFVPDGDTPRSSSAGPEAARPDDRSTRGRGLGTARSFHRYTIGQARAWLVNGRAALCAGNQPDSAPVVVGSRDSLGRTQ